MVAPSGQRPSYTFTKAERLKSRKRIKALFDKGASFSLYPFRFIYLTIDEPSESPVQCMVSVSKRRFRKAHQRNRIKRQMREVYRHHKHHVLPSVPVEKTLLLALVYIGKQQEPYPLLESKLKKGLRRLLEKEVFRNPNLHEKA